MRIPKSLKIAIFGSSCTGKTSIAQPLSEQLSMPLRSCGTEIKNKANDLGVSFDNVPNEVHISIDAETVEWVASHDRCIVEGRFLDSVLVSLKDSVYFIKLITSDEERLSRMQKRGNTPLTLEALQNFDRNDDLFRANHYTDSPVNDLFLEINTSSLSVDQCVKQIVTKLLVNADHQ